MTPESSAPQPSLEQELKMLLMNVRSIAAHQRVRGGKHGPYLATIIETLADKLEAAALASPRPEPPTSEIPICEKCGTEKQFHPSHGCPLPARSRETSEPTLERRLRREAALWTGTGPNGLDYLGELLREAAAALKFTAEDRLALAEDFLAVFKEMVERGKKLEVAEAALVAGEARLREMEKEIEALPRYAVTTERMDGPSYRYTIELSKYVEGLWLLRSDVVAALLRRPPQE